MKMWHVRAYFFPSADLKSLLLFRSSSWLRVLNPHARKERPAKVEKSEATQNVLSLLFCHMPSSCMTLVKPFLFLGLPYTGMGSRVSVAQTSPGSFLLRSTPSFFSLSLLVLGTEPRALHNLSTQATAKPQSQSFRLQFLAVYDGVYTSCDVSIQYDGDNKFSYWDLHL